MIDNLKHKSVLHIIDTLQIGGAERVCIDQCNLLFTNGIKVEILTITKKGALSQYVNPLIPIHCLERKSKLNLFNYLKMIRLIYKFDLVHIHMRHTFRYVKTASLWFPFLPKFVFQDHYGSIKKDKSIPILMYTLLKPKFYIGVSEELNQWATNILKIKINNVFLLQNIIIPENLKLNVQKEEKFISVGSISRIKNQLFTVKLVHKLGVFLDIYGNVVDNEYYNEIVRYISINKLDNKIQIISNNSNIQSLLPKYKFALHTAISESGPLVLMEYLANGIPFLSFKTGEVVSIIENDLQEFIIDDLEIENWIERLHNFKEYKPEDLKQVFDTHFNSDKYIEKCLNIYKIVLNY